MATPSPSCQRRYCCFSSRSSFSSSLSASGCKIYRVATPKPPQIPVRVAVSLPVAKILLLKKTSNLSLSAVLSSDSEPDSNEKRLDEGREAVRDYLEQLGTPPEEARRISSNCPNYLNMLIDGVDDLSHWNSLTAVTDTDITGDESNFRKKVYQMAEQKGDNGLLPFLESLGLTLASATHLARYVSSSESCSLPSLIHKVNYLKGILYSGSDNSEILVRNARRIMAHLSISADDDVQLTLAFLEKIQARRGGLDRLGIESTSFRCLIESFPRLLIYPLESRMKAMLTLLGDMGVPKQYISYIFLVFPPMLFYGVEEVIKPRLRLFNKIGAKDIELGKMLVKYPWILSTGILENFEKVLNFLDSREVQRVYSSRAIMNWPHVLGSSIVKLKLMVEHFVDMGIEPQNLGQVIAKSPELLLRKPQELTQTVAFFKDQGMDSETIAHMLVRCPEIFAANRERTLQKKLSFLYGIGISKTHLSRIVRKYPELFVCDIERALLPRIDYLRNSGLSKQDVVSMVHRFSPLLGYSIDEVLRPKMEFLVNIMQRPASDVVEYPRYFSYSLEKKIKPRFWVLKAGNIEFSLKEMLGKNDEEFKLDYLEQMGDK